MSISLHPKPKLNAVTERINKIFRISNTLIMYKNQDTSKSILNIAGGIDTNTLWCKIWNCIKHNLGFEQSVSKVLLGLYTKPSQGAEPLGTRNNTYGLDK